jgi:hypothetical protein
VLTDVFPHTIEVNEPQVPENTWIIAPEVLRLVPIELNPTLKFAPETVMLYQTSSSGVPVAHPVGIPELALAAQTVPDELITPLVNEVELEHSSFTGNGL